MATNGKETAKELPKDSKKIVFNVSKEELGNPARNMKKLKDILKDNHKCALNKDDVKYEKIKNADVLIFAAPTKKFMHAELTDLERYLEDGKHILLMADEGGEDQLGSNFNFLLEKYNLLVNGDTVIRTAYFKYFHPKEVFVQNGVVDEDFIRVANNVGPQAGMKKHKRTQLAFEGEADEPVDSGLAGYHFVYPYGCTLTVKQPAQPVLTSGPISYPVNQPVCAYTKTKKGGVLIVVGSYKFLCDDYIEKEENTKLVNFIENLFTTNNYAPHVPDKKKDADEPITENLFSAPDIAEMAETLKPCLQDSEDISRIPSNLYFRKPFSINFDMVPEAIGLYKKLNVKYESLTLIPPQFETPMLGLVPAVFPPILGELPPPKLELYDLDDEFADQKAKLANLTNKTTNSELEHYIRESAHILGITNKISSNNSHTILNHILAQLIKYKKNDH